jgi:hypothetical protein
MNHKDLILMFFFFAGFFLFVQTDNVALFGLGGFFLALAGTAFAMTRKAILREYVKIVFVPILLAALLLVVQRMTA